MRSICALAVSVRKAIRFHDQISTVDLDLMKLVARPAPGDRTSRHPIETARTILYALPERRPTAAEQCPFFRAATGMHLPEPSE